MNKINFKLLFKQIIIPITLFVISLLFILRGYDNILTSQSQKVISLITILPILPYFLFGILILLAFRDNNRQLFITILLSVYLQGRGFVGLLPVLFAGVIGYLISILFGLVDPSPITNEAWLRVPRFSLPAISDPRAWGAVGTIAVIAIATIPESTAHLYQISLYVDELAVRLGREKYNLEDLIGLNLVLDGLGDLINGMFGGVAGTNYGENNSLMVITRNYSGPALIAEIQGKLQTVASLRKLIRTKRPSSRRPSNRISHRA